MNLKEFNNLPPDFIFAKGIAINEPEGIYMTDFRRGDKLLWIAKKGYANDWCIYLHWEESGEAFVESNGDKVMNIVYIRRLVHCTDEVFTLYRY